MSLRERTRRTVQLQIAETAAGLFVRHGYEATTIDDIAAAVGMSKRSVFRYFAAKEDIVVGKVDLAGEAMLAALHARPAGEPAWTSLRRIFDVMGSPERQEATREVQRMVLTTPALLAVYLGRLQVFQGALADLLRERGATQPRALVAAAFGCFVAAQHEWLDAAPGEPLSAHLDRAMNAFGPVDGP